MARWSSPWRRFFSLRWWRLTFSRERYERHSRRVHARARECVEARGGDLAALPGCLAESWYVELYEEFQEGPARWGADEA